MQVRFLLGPAGSGKTFTCLQEIRRALVTEPAGPPLVLLAPKQATFQLERQLLEDDELSGYTRLQILSFDRLASFVLTQLAVQVKELLAEEGRLMVLRALLAREKEGLAMYRASAHQPGFAAQLSQLLREMQRSRIGPAELAKMAEDEAVSAHLRAKLTDLALLAGAYRDWLEGQGLNDADEVLELAANRLKALEIPSRLDPANPPPFFLASLWLDGFAEMTPQEVELMAALMPFCQQATLAFCLPAAPGGGDQKFSLWNLIGASYAHCRERLGLLSECEIDVQVLPRDPVRSRFAASPALAALEARWDERRLLAAPEDVGAVRLVACMDRDTEAVYAAREIRRHVRAGGRYREVTVLVRDLQDYGHVLRRVFTHYGIPFFLDQRESAAHHPVAELTRFALRTVAYNWQQEDWFGVLKTGLCGVGDSRIDWLENLSLAFGWEGGVWKTRPAKMDIEGLEEAWEQVRAVAVLPVMKLGEAVEGDAVSGRALARAVRGLWSQLKVSRQLERWSEARWPGAESRVYFHEPAVVHRTVWEQMNAWLGNLETAFADESVTMPLREWLPIIEVGLSNLSVGVIPPAIDQVLVGAIDRTRNPEVEAAFVMGLNEGVFPAVPGQPVLLTEQEREQLSGRRISLGQAGLHQLANERYLGYIACTRPQKRLHLTWATTDERGHVLPWSSLVDHVSRTLRIDQPETFSLPVRPEDAEHYSEVVADVMRTDGEAEQQLRQLPKLAEVAQRWTDWQAARGVTAIGPGLTELIFPTPWKTSVSALETFAQCPFRFYARYGLRAKERQYYEPDVREKGTYQHDVLEEFHNRAMKLGGWDRLEVDDARALVTDIADELRSSSAEGKMDHDEVTRFQADNLVVNLEKLVTSIVGWMGTYSFRPEVAELGFGLDGEDGLPAMEIDLGEHGTMLLRGRIDRVDLLPTDDDPGKALVAIADYKSSPKAVDETLLANGLQLQLLSYLHVVRELPGLAERLGKRELIPAGVFYVSLRPGNSKSVDRDKVVVDESAWRAGFQHQGRLNAQWLEAFDSSGGKSRQFKSRGKDQAPPERFNELQKMVVEHVRSLGVRVMGGEAAASPYRHKGAAPCDYCEFSPVCRFDSWETEYRALRKPTFD
jgi:ATP-dependent helicase/nuclease subunit B